MNREKQDPVIAREAATKRTRSERVASREHSVANLGALLADEETGVRARYDAGRIVLKLTARRRYGSRAMGVLARAVGYGESTLHRCAIIARAWSPRAFDALAAQMRSAGCSLSFCQLAYLASIPSTRGRRFWIEQTLRNGWSVRDLKSAREGGLELVGKDARRAKLVHGQIGVREVLEECEGISFLPPVSQVRDLVRDSDHVASANDKQLEGIFLNMIFFGA